MSPLRLNGSTSGFSELSAPAVAADRTFTLPNSYGSNGQVLTTNGSGTLSWTGMGPAFRAYRSTDFTVTNNTATKIDHNTEDYDTNNCYENATNFRFTPTVAGYYLVTAQVYATATTAMTRGISAIFKNGVQISANNNGPYSGTVAFSLITDIVYANGTTDYFEHYCNFLGTGTLTVQANNDTTFFTAALIRPA